MQGFLRYSEALTGLDECGGAFCDNPNRYARNKQLFTRGQVDTRFLNETLKQTVGASFSHQHYADNSTPSDEVPSVLLSQYTGAMHKVDFQNTWIPADYFTLIGGAETSVESGNSDYHSESAFGTFDSNFSNRTATNNGYYIEGITKSYDMLYTTAGLRLDDHSKSGTDLTWRIAPALLFRESDTKFSTTIGTGFKAPSLFQLYSSYGDENLKAERSLGLDAGVEQGLFDKKLRLSTTFFYNKFRDLITFDPNTFLFNNIANANTRGLESTALLKMTDELTLSATYTLTDTKDKDTDLPLLRRARNKGSLTLGYDPLETLHITTTAYFTGKRYDSNFSVFPVERLSLSGYGLVDVAASYDLSKTVHLFGRVENIFDRDYEEVFGFGTRGAAAYGGIRLEL